jgi:acetolactate synthase I/II/III large subunit
MKISGAELLVRVLESNDVKYVFGVPGGHVLKFYDSLYDSKQITPILTKHESGASFMATGYAQVEGTFGVCTGTVGPGATNLTTGVASAYMDSIPLLVITGQVGITAIGKGGLQEATGEGRTIDHVEFFDGITKYSTRILSTSRLREAFRNSLRVALNGRPGPAHLDIMAHVFLNETEEDDSSLIEKIVRFPSAGDQKSIGAAAKLIVAANRPAILAGAGAMEAGREVLQIVEQYSIPLATTLRAKGIIPEDHPLCLGCLGLYGTNAANKYLRSGVDVLLAVGASFSEYTSHSWDGRFQPSVGLIQIDVDSWEIGKNYPVAVGIQGDSQPVMQKLLMEMESQPKPKALSDAREIAEMKQHREYFADPKMASQDIPIKPQRFLKTLREVLPRDTIIFSDIGDSLAWVEGFFQIYSPKTFYICSTLASMGYGVSAAIGGQLAAPDRQVVCICGDGDFQMQGMEVVTAVNYNIPVKWFIVNNQSLAMVRDAQDTMFKGRRIASEFKNPDFSKLAEAMGAVGLRISRPEEIEPVVKQALDNKRPTVIDVVIDTKEAPSFDARAEAMARAWGISNSAPLFTKIKKIPDFLKRM